MNTKLEFATKMQGRTKAFAVQVVKFYGKLPKTDEARVLGRQLLRAGTSVAANYRGVCRANSDPDFIHKLGTVVEEADESLLWLQWLEETGICLVAQVATFKKEAGELVRILQTFLNTAKRNAAVNSLIH
jgi:four helix bundle protein